MRKYLLAVMMTGIPATPALAQSTEPSRFSGIRVEAVAGYDMLRPGNDGNDDGDSSAEEGGDDSIDGVMYGLGVGFDLDLGGVVAGIEGEISDSTGKQKGSDTFDGIDVAAGLSVGRDLYVGGRIGFAAGPSTLIYAKGGYTNTTIDAFAEISGERFEDDASVDGFRLGAGIEQMFGANAYGKLEYRYSRYGKLELSDELAEEADEAGAGKIDLDRHQVVVAFGFRF